MVKKMVFSVVAVSLVWILTPVIDAAEEATEAEYKERIARYDVKSDPDDHKRIAAWCKKNYPSRYQHHITAYNQHLFSQEVAKLPSTPTANHYKVLREKAEKLELPNEAQTYLGKWGEIQFAAFAAKMKPGDPKMMKQLVEWSDRQGIAFIEPVQKLAEEVLVQDPDYALSRKILNHVQWEDGWLSLDDAIDQIKIGSVKDRIKVHQAAAAARTTVPRTYPANPTRGMDSQDGYYRFSPAKSPSARFFLMEQGYSSKKPCRLILALHGGGGGGSEAAENYASIAMQSWKKQKGDHIILAPIASDHVPESWRDKSNVLEIIDALEEVCERFNIDRKRIYVTGHSMGGAGTTTWYAAFPEFAAASCGRAGWFQHWAMQKDLLQKPIMIIQGEDDTEKRVKSKEGFLKMAKSNNGNVTNISYPGIGHDIPDSMSFDKFMPFFEEHTNEIEPDFDVLRKAAKKWMEELK